MSLTGDFGKLEAAIRQLDDIDRSKIAKAAAAVSKEAGKLYHEGFDAKSDPWGRSWPQSASNANTGVLTGALRSVIRQTSSANRVTLKPMARYAKFFQIGAPTRHGFGDASRQRGIVPYAHGSKWDPVIEDTLERELDLDALGR